MLGSKESDMVNNANIYDDLYLSEKEDGEKLLQGIQLTNGLKAHAGAKKADGTALRVTTKEIPIKKTFGKGFPHLWILTFLNILYILMDLKKI